MKCDDKNRIVDCGMEPYVMNVNKAARLNKHFRVAVWTGKCAQMTLMCIPPKNDIGWEIHNDTDQIIRIEQGKAMVCFGNCKGHSFYEKEICEDDVVFVPMGTWHNIVNIGDCSLRVSSVYAPPHHPKGTIQHTKEEAEH